MSERLGPNFPESVSPAAIEAISEIEQICTFSAPSGAGKNSGLERLAQRLPIQHAISYTNRPMRAGEEHGKNYLFLGTPDEFLELFDAGEILEKNEYNGNLYGKSTASILAIHRAGKLPIFEMDINGSNNLYQAAGDKVWSMFILPGRTMDEWRPRIERNAPDLLVRLGRLKEGYDEICKAVEGGRHALVVNRDEGLWITTALMEGMVNPGVVSIAAHQEGLRIAERLLEEIPEEIARLEALAG